MSRRARARENARPWNNPGALSLDPETDDDLEEGEQPEDEYTGDWSSDIHQSKSHEAHL